MKSKMKKLKGEEPLSLPQLELEEQGDDSAVLAQLAVLKEKFEETQRLVTAIVQATMEVIESAEERDRELLDLVNLLTTRLSCGFKALPDEARQLFARSYFQGEASSENSVNVLSLDPGSP